MTGINPTVTLNGISRTRWMDHSGAILILTFTIKKMSILIVIPHWGLTTGIKVQSAKHYTMEPHPAGKNLMLF